MMRRGKIRTLWRETAQLNLTEAANECKQVPSVIDQSNLEILAEVAADASASLTKGRKTSMIKNDDINQAAVSLGLTPEHFVGLDCR